MKVELLDHRDSEVAQAVVDLSLASYAVEAGLIGCDDFPPLRVTRAKIQQSESLFYGVWNNAQLLGVVEVEKMPGLVEVHRLVVSPLSFRQCIVKCSQRSGKTHCSFYCRAQLAGHCDV